MQDTSSHKQQLEVKTLATRRGIDFSVFKRRVIFHGVVKLLSGLHIGTGRVFGATASDMPVLKDFNEQPFIPGSSFKGVYRSNLEAFLRAFQSPSSAVYLACDPVGEVRPCLGKDAATKDALEKILRKYRRKKNRDSLNLLTLNTLLWTKSCWICRLFGSSWLASKVQILDMPVVAEKWIPESLMVRDGVVIDRESETAATRGKFDFEAVPAGTEFKLEILVENPEDYELGLLMLGFDLFSDGFALLGGNTSRGLGRIQIELSDIVDVSAEDLLAKFKPQTEEEPETKEDETQKSEQETETKQIDAALQAVCDCLKQHGSLTHEELVKAMQEIGWTKERLNEVDYDNYKKLFDKAVKAKLIDSPSEGSYRSLEAMKEEESSKPESSEGQTKEAEIEKLKEKWLQALWKKLQQERGL
jgi:CRISPR-associated RAMP protein (TIGR02581 family)